MDQSACLAQLIASFARQLEWYRELRSGVQKSLGKLVLSRGDLSTLNESLGRKQDLLDSIGREREGVRELVVWWQEHKSALPGSPLTKEFSGVLEQTEATIREFLDSEEQMRRYLEHLIKKGSPTATCP